MVKYNKVLQCCTILRYFTLSVAIYFYFILQLYYIREIYYFHLICI